MKIFQIYTLDSSALNTSGIPGNGMSQCTVCSLLVLAEYYSCPPALTPTGVWSPLQSQPNQTNVRTSYRHRSNTLARPCRQAPVRRLLDNGKSQRNFRSSAHDLCDYAAQKRGKGKMSRLWIQPSCLHYLQVAGAEPLIIDRSKAHSEGSLLPWLDRSSSSWFRYRLDGSPSWLLMSPPSLLHGSWLVDLASQGGRCGSVRAWTSSLGAPHAWLPTTCIPLSPPFLPNRALHINLSSWISIDRLAPSTASSTIMLPPLFVVTHPLSSLAVVRVLTR